MSTYIRNIHSNKIENFYLDKKGILSYSILINLETYLISDICNIINNYLLKCYLCNRSKKCIFYLNFTKKFYLCLDCLKSVVVNDNIQRTSILNNDLKNCLYCLICNENKFKGNINKHIECKKHTLKLTKIFLNKRKIYEKNLIYYKQIIDKSNFLCNCNEILNINNINEITKHQTESKKHKDISYIINILKKYEVNSNVENFIGYIDTKIIDKDIFIELDNNVLDRYCFLFSQNKRDRFNDILEKEIKLKCYIKLYKLMNEKFYVDIDTDDDSDTEHILNNIDIDSDDGFGI